MQKRPVLAALLTVAALALLTVCASYRIAKAQGSASNYPTSYELLCPTNFQPVTQYSSWNPTTQRWRANICVDGNGNFNLNGNSIAGPAGPPGPPGTNGGVNGGALSSGNTSPGMFLGGPIPTPGGNPFFETSSINSLPSAPGSATATVSGTPATASSTAIFMVLPNTGSHPPAPDATWTTLDNSNWTGALYYKNLTTGTQLNVSTNLTPSDGWDTGLAFFGGTITAVSGTTLSTACGTGCTQGTATVTAGHLELVIVSWSSGNFNIQQPSVTDTLGNQWTRIANVYNGGIGFFAFTAQVVNGGSDTITANGNETTSNLFQIRAYDITGPTAYYTGASGPYTFRYITPQDLTPNLFPTGMVKYFTQNLGADVASLANNSNTVLLTQAVTMPTSGCPCRAEITYGIGVNSGNSHLFEGWISDGTNSSISVSNEYVNTGLTYSVSGSGVFPNSSTATYSNGQAVTFTLNLSITTLAAGSVTAKQLGPGGRQATWMQIDITTAGN